METIALNNDHLFVKCYKSDDGRYIYAVLCELTELEFFRIFPKSIPINEDELEKLIAENPKIELIEITRGKLNDVRKLKHGRN